MIYTPGDRRPPEAAMSALEEIQFCIKKVEGMLAQDYMTTPVRQILTEVLASLTSAAADLSE